MQLCAWPCCSGAGEEELWYLHVEGGFYAFSSQPNLNRVIIEKEEAVKDDLIMKEIRSRLEQLAGKELRVMLWPKASQDVPDTRELKLAILSPEHTKQSSTTSALVDELLKKYGAKFRTYQNTLLVLVPESGEFALARQKIRRLLALRAIRDDKALMRQLSEENKKTLESKIRDLEGGIPFSLLSAYRHLAKPGENGVEWFDLGLPTVGERGSLAKRVLEYLKSQEVLLERISPSNLLKKALREDEQEKPISDISEAFLRYPQLPMVQSLAVIEQAISQGLRDGVFAVKIGERVYCGETPPVSLKVPWDKLSDFVRGVILPLRNDGAALEVEVYIQARSESGGIKPATLEHKVKETLRQIGAETLEEFHE
jgi:hypothetical protein